MWQYLKNWVNHMIQDNKSPLVSGKLLFEKNIYNSHRDYKW